MVKEENVFTYFLKKKKNHELWQCFMMTSEPGKAENPDSCMSFIRQNQKCLFMNGKMLNYDRTAREFGFLEFNERLRFSDSL